MARRIAVTAVRGAGVEDLEKAGLVPDGDTLSGAEAVAVGLGNDLYAVAVGDDVVLIGGWDGPDLATVLAEGLGVEVVHALCMGAVDFYEWTVRHGETVRTWSWGDGEEITDLGAAVPEEDGTFLLDETVLLGLFEARTGIAESAWARAEIVHHLRGAPPTGGAVQPQRKRRFWRRKEKEQQ